MQNFAAQIVYKRPENPLQYLVEELERRREETAKDIRRTEDSGLQSWLNTGHSEWHLCFLPVTHTFLALIKDYKIFLVAEKTSAILRRSPLYYNQFYPWCKRWCLACVQPPPPLKKREEKMSPRFWGAGNVHRLNDTLSVIARTTREDLDWGKKWGGFAN